MLTLWMVIALLVGLPYLTYVGLKLLELWAHYAGQLPSDAPRWRFVVAFVVAAVHAVVAPLIELVFGLFMAQPRRIINWLRG